MYTRDICKKVVDKIQEEYKDNEFKIPTIDTYIDNTYEELTNYFGDNSLFEVKKAGGTDCKYIHIPKTSWEKKIKGTNFGISYVERIYFIYFEKRIFIIISNSSGGYTNRFDKTTYSTEFCLIFGEKTENFEKFIGKKIINNFSLPIQGINDLHLIIKKLYGVANVNDENKVLSEELSKDELLKLLKTLFTYNYGKNAKFYKFNRTKEEITKVFDQYDFIDICKNYLKHKIIDFNIQTNNGFNDIINNLIETFSNDLEIKTVETKYGTKQIQTFKLHNELYNAIYKKVNFTLLDKYYEYDVNLEKLSSLLQTQEINYNKEVVFKNIEFYIENEKLISNNIKISESYVLKNENIRNLKKVKDSCLEDESKILLNKIIELETSKNEEIEKNKQNEIIEIIKTYFDNINYIIKIDFVKENINNTYFKINIEILSN